MKSKFKLYQQVVLSKDYPEEKLKQGDVATIAEIIEKENKVGLCLEFFDNDGKTLKVIITGESNVSEVKPHSVVNYLELITH